MTRAIIVTVTLIVYTHCSDSVVLTEDAKAKARAFYSRHSVLEQMQGYGRYTIEDQYDILIYGNQVRHPPAHYLARCFALNGQAGVDPLRSELKIAADDLTVRDDIKLLTEIDAMRMYDVAQDVELMRRAEARISQMKDPRWRDSAEKMFARIGHARESERGFAPRCGQPTSKP